jgi:hypothetical protein
VNFQQADEVENIKWDNLQVTDQTRRYRKNVVRIVLAVFLFIVLIVFIFIKQSTNQKFKMFPKDLVCT